MLRAFQVLIRGLLIPRTKVYRKGGRENFLSLSRKMLRENFLFVEPCLTANG
jgi:hypothetical protein